MMVTLYSIQGHAQEDVIYYPRLREQIQPSLFHGFIRNI